MLDNPDFYKTLIDNLHDGIYFVDRERNITYWNKGAERITGYKAANVVGSSCRDNILNHITASGVQLCHDQCPLAATMQDGQYREAEVFLHHHDGHRVPVVVRASPIRDEEGNIIGAVETFSNNAATVNVRRRAERFRRSALMDVLTGIGNRRYLETRLRVAKAELEHGNGSAGIIFIDIDNFKKVNDLHGHNIGDRILQMVSMSLKNNLRDDDTLGRWGGDEFLAIVYNTDKLKSLKAIVEKLRVMVEYSRLDLTGAEVSVTISIGATLLTADNTIESQVHRVDRLMYASKEKGRNRTTVK